MAISSDLRRRLDIAKAGGKPTSGTSATTTKTTDNYNLKARLAAAKAGGANPAPSSEPVKVDTSKGIYNNPGREAARPQREALSWTEQAQRTADNILEQSENPIVQAQKRGSKTYDDNFFGQFGASYNLGRLSQDESAAWNDYLANPTEENRKKAQGISDAKNTFTQNNKSTLDDNATAPLLSKSLAGYLPQLGDQLKANAVGGATGALVGSAVPIIGTATGITAGVIAGSGKQAYDTMRGAAFKSLLDLGIDEETARKAAKDEALVSSLIEMADTGVDLATLGAGKLISLVAKGGIKLFAKKGAGEAAETAAKKFAKALGGYGINIASEAAQEGVQEAVSIANEDRTRQGETGALNLIGNTAQTLGGALTGNAENASRIGTAAKEGAKIAAMLGGVTSIGSNVAANAINNNRALSANPTAPIAGNTPATSQPSTVAPNDRLASSADSATLARATNYTPANAVGQGANNAAVSTAEIQHRVNQVKSMERTVGKSGASMLSSIYNPETQDSVSYLEDALVYYNAGAAGKKIDAVAPKNGILNTAQQEGMYLAGQADATNGSLVPGSIPGYNKVTTTESEDLNYGRTEQGDAGSSRDGERAYNLVTGEPGRGMETRTSAAQSGRPRGAQAERAAQIRTAAKTQAEVSTAGQGISLGTDNNTLRVVPSTLWTPEMRTLSRAQGSAGRQVIYFTGSLEMRDAGGVFTARGAVAKDGKRIWVRADHDTLTVEQIIKHEEFHAKVMDDSRVFEKVREDIISGHSEAELEAMADFYAAEYFTDSDGNVTVTQDYILEEVFADAYAGINVFDGIDNFGDGAVKFSDSVNAATEGSENAAATDRKTGPPEERFSIDPEFARKIDTWDGKSKQVFKVGTTSGALQSIGIESRKIVWYSGKITDILRKHQGMTRDIIKQVPEILENPIVVLKSQNSNGRIAIFGSVRDENGAPVTAILELQPTNSGGELLNMNVIASAYGKDSNPAQFIKNSELLYLDADKNRTKSWMQSVGLQLPSDANAFGSIGSVSYQDGKVKIEGVPYDQFMQGSAKDTQEKLSREAQSLNELREQNEDLREKIDYLKSQTKRSEGKTLRQGDIDKFAKSLVKHYSSEIKADEISERLKSLGEYIISDGDGKNELTYTEVKDRALDIAKDVVQNSYELVNSDDLQTYKEIRSYLRNTKLAFDDQGDIADFNDFRKRNFGRFVIYKYGQPVDVAYQELNSSFGEAYFPSDIINPADQLVHIAELLDGLAPIYENPYSYYMAEALEYCANDIIDGLVGDAVRQSAPTFADRQAEKLDAQTAKGRRQAKAAIERERNRRIKQVSELKEHYHTKENKARESRNASAMRRKIAKHSKDLSAKLLRPTDKKHVPEALRVHVAAMLEAINLESNYTIDPENGTRYDDKVGLPTKRTMAFNKLKEAYKGIVGEVIVDPDLLGDDVAQGLLDDVIQMADTPIASMNTTQLETIWQTLRAVEASIVTANKMFAAGRFETVSDAAEWIRADNAGKTQKTEYNYISGLQSLTGLDMLTPEAFLHRLGSSGDAIFRMMRNAQDEHIKIMKSAEDATHKIIGKTDIRKLEREMHTVAIGGQEVELSTAQIMELYVLSRRQQAADHIYKGGILPDTVSGRGLKKKTTVEPIRGIDPFNLGNVFAKLTAEQIAIAEKLQSYLSTDMAEYGNKASMEVYNYKKFGESNYWPIRTNQQELISSVEKDNTVTSVANRGFTKLATPKANTSVRVGSIFDTYSSHVTEMATYAAWLGTSEDINRIRNFTFRDEDNARIGTVKGIIDRVHGTNGSRYLQKLLSDIANGIKGTHGETDYMGGITANYKAAAMGANLRVVIQQPTSLLRALDVIDIKYLASGMKPNSGWEKAKKRAPIAQWKDWGYFDINTGRQMKDVLFDSSDALNKIRQGSMWLAGKADSLAWGQLWNACEAETKAKRTDLTPNTDEFYKAVAERFSEVVDHTQVVDGILQRSQIMRRSDGLTKMATSFMGEPTKVYNMLLSATYDVRHAQSAEARTAAKRRLARTAFTLVVAGAANAMAQSVIDAERDDDKEKEYWEKWLAAFGENFANMINPALYIPYVKDAVSIIQGYDVSRMDMESIEKTITAGTNALKALSGEGKYTIPNSFAALFFEAARLFGVPVANLKREVKSFAMLGAVESKNYLMQYRMERASLSLNYAGNNKAYLDILYGASLNDREAYEIIYADMVKNGFSTDAIKNGMEKRMKDAQGVKKVDELENRYLTPPQETKYNSIFGEVSTSANYRKSDEEERKAIEELAYQIATETLLDSTAEKIKGGAKYGVDETDYILYRLALSMQDQQKDESGYGSYSQDEANAALRSIPGLSKREKDYLWQSTNKAWKK